MSDLMPEAQRAPSPEALADLKALAPDHGVSKSLRATEAVARKHDLI